MAERKKERNKKQKINEERKIQKDRKSQTFFNILLLERQPEK